ncbi:MAG: surface protein [Hungatella sp.]|nr:surface protein [Hungatella sp.]MDR1547716.1 surface protein [Hungatella sp.]
MRKLPVFVLAAATVLTVAGVPMTAQAATCPVSSGNCYTISNCFGQSGDINSILSKLGCGNGNSCSNGTTCTNGSTCSNGSTGTKGATCSGSNCGSSKNSSCSSGKNNSSCSKTKGATTNSGRQCKSSYGCWR